MATRPRTSAPRYYEDFQPPSNLLQEEECETLVVDLPGFRKEQVRVQMDDRSGTVLISGERPTGLNKLTRFRKDLRVPNSCNTNEIQAKFENGILRIIMPLKVVPTPANQKPIPPPPPPPSQKPVTVTNPTPAPPSQKQFPEPRPTPAPRPPPSQKLVTEPVSTLPPQASQKPVTRPKPIPVPPPLPNQKPTPTPQPIVSEKLKPTPASQHPLTQKPEALQSPRSPLSPKQTTETTWSQKLGIKSKYEISEDDSSGQNIASTNIAEKQVELKTGKQENDAPNTVKEKKWTDGFADVGKYMGSTSEHKEKGKDTKDDKEVKDEPKESVTDGLADYKNETRRLAMEPSESKQYIVNMVAAVLVIVALWVYTKYTVKTFI